MLLCVYCNSERKNLNSLRNHERLCPLNENRVYKNGMLGKKGSNQFTTGRQTYHSEETKNKLKIHRTGKKVSKETKDKLSKIRKKFLSDNPDKVPYLLNHSSRTSYPEEYFSECFKGIVNLNSQYRVFDYKLDFVNIDEKLCLEIDGDQHYVDQKIIAHDIKRTDILEKSGWVIFRIRWSHFKSLSFEEKSKKVEEIIKLMKWIY